MATMEIPPMMLQAAREGGQWRWSRSEPSRPPGTPMNASGVGDAPASQRYPDVWAHTFRNAADQCLTFYVADDGRTWNESGHLVDAQYVRDTLRA